MQDPQGDNLLCEYKFNFNERSVKRKFIYLILNKYKIFFFLFMRSKKEMVLAPPAKGAGGGTAKETKGQTCKEASAKKQNNGQHHLYN